MKTNIIRIGLLVGVAFIASSAFKKESVYCKTIAVTQIVEHAALDATYAGIMDALAESGYYPGENLNLVFESAQGDAVMASQIATKFAGLKPDVIVAIGTTSAQAMKQMTDSTDIPVVFSSITDPLGAKLVDSLDKPGSNVTGYSNWVDVAPQLAAFKKVIPTLATLGVIYNPGEANSVAMVETIIKEAAKSGVEVTTAAATNTSEVSSAARSIVNDVDALFVSNDNTALSAFESIVQVGNAADTPVFVSDTDLVERGAAAALGPNQFKLGQQTGRMIVEILGGKKPELMAVGFPEETEFHINTDALATIRLAVPDRVIIEADSLLPIRG